ncbi:MAG: hypothetical protein RLZZ540_3187 [Bacteroidota bacterium]|jgi:hypothetical protein
MKKLDVNTLTLTVIPITMYFDETHQELATGTAFIYEYNQKFYLITNWHNVTGENPLTGKPLGNNAGRPDILVMTFMISKQPLRWGNFTVNLYEDNSAEWLVHPIHKKKVDVVAIELEASENFTGLIHPINKIKFDDYKLEVADDVFILGFPYSLKGGLNFPIWKKGSVATEPDIDYDDLPKFLIDATTKRGMSGSPVVFKRNGFVFGNSKQLADTKFGVFQDFIGVYSGRIRTEFEEDSNLGIIWKRQVIEEIIIGNCKDDRKFE